MHRDEAIKRIGAALKRRSGKAWSVTGDRGTAWGWINIDAPPARRTWHFRGTTVHDDGTVGRTEEVCLPGHPYGHMGPDDRAELTKLLGLNREVHHQGESVPPEAREVYVDAAEGKMSATCGQSVTCPDDLIRFCVRERGHTGFCDAGVR